MITYGVLLGKLSVLQLWLVATIEVIFFSLNKAVSIDLMMTVDNGGCIYIHVFAAYFGMAASYFFRNREAKDDENHRCEGDYTSQTIAMVGTLFLFSYWPSFNSALAIEANQEKVMINTLFCLCGGCVGALGISRLLYQ